LARQLELREIAVVLAAGAIVVVPISVVAARLPTLTAMSASSSIPHAAAPMTTANWLEYHHDSSRAGGDSGEPTFTNLYPAWTQSSLVGQIYARLSCTAARFTSPPRTTSPQPPRVWVRQIGSPAITDSYAILTFWIGP
jgi:hypothetical protein